MQRFVIGAVLVAFTIGTYYLAAPPAAVTGLRDAIIRGDTIEIGDRVDLTRVRQGLKDQVNAAVLGPSYHKMASNPFGKLAIAVTSNLLEATVDSYLTPSGLGELARGRTPGDASIPSDASNDPAKPEPHAPEPPEQPFARSRIDRESLDRFSAWVPAQDGGEIRFVFRREGLGWKLTDIILPTSG